MTASVTAASAAVKPAPENALVKYTKKHHADIAPDGNYMVIISPKPQQIMEAIDPSPPSNFPVALAKLIEQYVRTHLYETYYPEMINASSEEQNTELEKDAGHIHKDYAGLKVWQEHSHH